jgi:hypothetical protein
MVTQLELDAYPWNPFPVESLQNFSKLTHLILGMFFNQPINTLLPPSLQKLHFGLQFDQPILFLSSSLLEITFPAGARFNHPIDGLLPASLTILTLNDLFNYSVDLLPHKLTELRLGRSFNQRVDHLSYLLKILCVDGRVFNHPVNSLSPHLVKLQIYTSQFNQNVDHLPPCLVELQISSHAFQQDIDHLPSSLRILSSTKTSKKFPTNLPPSV